MDSKKLIKKIFLGLMVIMILFIAVEFAAAGKYKAMVKVSQKEGYLGVNPLTDRLDFGDLCRGAGASRYLTLRNNGSIPVYIKIIKFGDISDLIKIDKNNFILDSGNEAKIDFHLTVLPSADKEKYSGWILVFRIPKVL